MKTATQKYNLQLAAADRQAHASPSIFVYRGMQCKLCLNRVNNWCGYVFLPPSHPYYNSTDPAIDELDVHGSITAHAKGILGFDTSHIGDFMPSPERLLDMHHESDHYWTYDETVAETKRLADQLIEVALQSNCDPQQMAPQSMLHEDLVHFITTEYYASRCNSFRARCCCSRSRKVDSRGNGTYSTHVC